MSMRIGFIPAYAKKKNGSRKTKKQLSKKIVAPAQTKNGMTQDDVSSEGTAADDSGKQTEPDKE